MRDAGIDNVRALTDIPKALAASDIVITVTSAISDVVPADALRPGSVVCDVARPRDVSHAVALQREDVLVIEGGAVEVPGDVDFHFNFGFPPKTAYACMAETMMLALEGMVSDYSIGRDIAPEQVAEITALADKHGFKLAGFRSFERTVSEEFIAKTREKAERKRREMGIS
jgi:predicted amino acid dehydrogenase